MVAQVGKLAPQQLEVDQRRQADAERAGADDDFFESESSDICRPWVQPASLQARERHALPACVRKSSGAAAVLVPNGVRDVQQSRVASEHLAKIGRASCRERVS